MITPKVPRLYRRKQVIELTGIPRSSLYELERAGNFPKHFQVSPKISAWLAEDVHTWIQAQAEKRALGCNANLKHQAAKKGG